MLVKSSLSFNTRFRQFLVKLLVRFKRIKRAPVDIGDINQLFTQELPLKVDVDTPAGMGELSVLEVNLKINQFTDCLQAELLCNFSVSVKQNIIYNTHLQLTFNAKPKYDRNNKMISVSEVKMTGLNLISDQYSLIKDTRALMTGLIPEPFKTIFNMTFSSTQAILNNKAVNAGVKYLSLYLSGSKQSVIDYHRSDIENKIAKLTEDESMKYRLNESNFEEGLFAEYGKEIKIENGQLFFIFYS